MGRAAESAVAIREAELADQGFDEVRKVFAQLWVQSCRIRREETCYTRSEDCTGHIPRLQFAALARGVSHADSHV